MIHDEQQSEQEDVTFDEASQTYENPSRQKQEKFWKQL